MDDTENREAIDALLRETITVVERLYSWAARRVDEYFTMSGYSATQRLMEAHDALCRAQSEIEHDCENDAARERYVTRQSLQEIDSER